MGETGVRVKVYGPAGSVELEMLVDTGATFTKIPEPIASEIGLKADELIEVRLSDGSIRRRGFTEAKIEVEGIKRTVPIAIGPEGEEPLLGYTALEILQPKVDPVTRTLERTIPIEYRGSEVRKDRRT